MSDINGNKTFWKNVMPTFGKKNNGNKTIALVEGNEMVTNNGKLYQTFNAYFATIFPSLGITSVMTILIIQSQNLSAIQA